MLNVVETNFQIKDLAASLLDDIAASKNLRTLDALQLASSITTDQIFSISYFVASDQRLLQIANNYHKTLNPLDARF